MEKEKVTTVCSPRQDAGQRAVEARRRAWRGRRFTWDVTTSSCHAGDGGMLLKRQAVFTCAVVRKRSMLTWSRNKEVYRDEGI